MTPQYRRGLERVKEMLGEDILNESGEGIRTGIFSDFDEWTLGILFGDVWERPQLDRRDRSLATIAALIVLDRPNQLGTHIKGGLHHGLTRQEIAEVIMQMAFYGGWPVTVEAIKIANQAFEEYDSA